MTGNTTGVRAVDQLFATLRYLKYVIYLCGLGVVALATVVGPTWARTPLVVAALTVMCTTYLAELQGRIDGMRAETLVTALAVVGIAVGAYVIVEVNRIGGLLFLLGGILFFRVAAKKADT